MPKQHTPWRSARAIACAVAAVALAWSVAVVRADYELVGGQMQQITPEYAIGDLSFVTEKPGPYGGDAERLVVEVWFETNERLHLKISDPNTTDWQIPTSMLNV